MSGTLIQVVPVPCQNCEASPTAGDPNFSYIKILPEQSIVVPENQQMLFSGNVLVQGDMMVRGEVLDITYANKDHNFYTEIAVGEFARVNERRLMLYKTNLLVSGDLFVAGTLGVA